MKKNILILTTMTLLLTLLGVSPAYSQSYTVERVVDGDTLKLSNGEHVRLIGIDTPESKVNDKAKKDSGRSGQDLATIIKMGQEASEFVKKLVEGKEVRLEFDVGKKDKYGRLLVYVYLDLNGIKGLDDFNKLQEIIGSDCPGCQTNMYSYHSAEPLPNGYTSVFINATMIKAGYASPMTIPPNVMYADLFQKLYQEARGAKRGLWR